MALFFVAMTFLVLKASNLTSLSGAKGYELSHELNTMLKLFRLK